MLEPAEEILERCGIRNIGQFGRGWRAEKTVEQQRLITDARRDAPDAVDPRHQELRRRQALPEFVEKDDVRKRPAERVYVRAVTGSSQNRIAVGVLGHDDCDIFRAAAKTSYRDSNCVR